MDRTAPLGECGFFDAVFPILGYLYSINGVQTSFACPIALL